MFPRPLSFKQWGFVIVLCLITVSGRAETITLSEKSFTQLPLQPYFSAWEDLTGKTNVQGVIQHPESFSPLNNLSYSSPTSVYWLKVNLSYSGAIDPSMVLRFNHLTFVDAYLYNAGQLIWHHQAGAFRPRSQLEPGDSRFHFRLPLQAGQTYTLLLRVNHTKGYRPFFDFTLQDQEQFMEDTHTRERADTWSQGAVAIFLIYTLISWWVSRYRPYLWLGLFIAGVSLYGLCSGRYFIDWFLPENPTTGWLFNGPFLHLGLLGFYLLIVDFWQLPKYNPTIYRFGQLCIAALLLVSTSGVCINYFTGNFNLANTINLWAFVFPFTFVVFLIACCYRRLDRAQKYLYYGIVLFVAAGLFVTLSSAIIKERALLIAPYVSNFTSLAIFLLFSTGLKEALRQHEIDKLAVLHQLTQLQKEQNILLENKVTERTEALFQSNQLLQEQADLLAKRNATIETLINELSHRVKNNLQLLYSLNSLQLPHVSDATASHMLKSNLARIKAMMLVNQKLDYIEDTSQVSLASLVIELTRHLQDIYDRPRRVKLQQNIASAIELPSHQVLSLGLILTEMLTNSYKYAFPNISDPCISISISLSATGHIQLVYADNGIGIQPKETTHASSMGLSLIKDLTRQLNGNVCTNGEHGLAYTIAIPA
ncbi:7TM-DISM domain-containing protein [Flavisolibacter tropicus]|uniref:histidine kinase n=1 Tax=Flavisolibacter tropicus TaxID=1492898 RepID=A0A172TT80_9BACT|nr:7TM diverse intracellular signaling domain-containing protein [Flavisolibacter tropicus]ANE50084.1 hypothetical protein SY85_05805 [Flavisolibacter tropicus]